MGIMYTNTCETRNGSKTYCLYIWLSSRIPIGCLVELLLDDLGPFLILKYVYIVSYNARHPGKPTQSHQNQ